MNRDGIRRSDIRRLVRARCRSIMDPAGRPTPVIEEGGAEEIARSCCCSLREVYGEALRAGVYPCRYIRNRETIPIEAQLKLAESQVAVVGAGGLGGHVILLLARMGIGRLVVVDHDVFDETNLNRQPLSTPRTLGKSKSETAAQAVLEMNPAVEVWAHHCRIHAKKAPGLLTGSAVVVDALDNVADRFLLEDCARELEIPLVHGALAGLEGQVMTILPGDPGLSLLYGSPQPPSDPSQRPEAVLGVPTLTPSLIAALQCAEVVKLILGRGRLIRKMMLHVDLEMGRVDEFLFA